MHIRELRLVTSDLAMQHDFYVHGLSLPAPIITPDCLTVQLGTSRLTFVHAPLDAQPTYHFAFAIPPQQFAEAKAWIARCVPLLRDYSGADEFYFEAWQARAFYFYDPAGNIVELIAPWTSASQSDQPFTAQSLLGVSEIGLVTDSVPDTVQLLQAQLGVSIYQDTRSGAFAALGDEAGRFIVVQRGRIWFPDTAKPAADAPVSLTVTEGSTQATVAGPPYQVTLERRPDAT